MRKKWLCALLCAALLAGAGRALAMTRAEIRSAYAQLCAARTSDSPYLEEPDTADLSDCGALTQAAMDDALAYLNYLRAVAGLEPVALNALYALRCQNGALLMAARDQLSHAPEQPQGMDGALYESALLGAGQSNLARFNWMRPGILLDGVAYFARDDGADNLGALAHRRWLLNPLMAETGFGLANAADGDSYVLMYAVDQGNAAANWDYVAWPSSPCFPVDLMRGEIPWSISLNEAIYDLDAGAPRVTLRERGCGATFSFDFSGGAADGFCALSRAAYGAGGCLIFRPNLELCVLDEYLQNQIWDVCVEGLVRRDGTQARIEYSCEMVSLYPQDVANVELSQLEARLRAGESLVLSASVIPCYADDLSLFWSSSDESVARVDANGRVTAVSAGDCLITARSANGRQDACALRVDD